MQPPPLPPPSTILLASRFTDCIVPIMISNATHYRSVICVYSYMFYCTSIFLLNPQTLATLTPQVLLVLPPLASTAPRSLHANKASMIVYSYIGVVRVVKGHSRILVNVIICLNMIIETGFFYT